MSSYLTAFGLSEPPFSKEVPDADLWLPSSKQAAGKGVTKSQCDVYEQRQVVHRCRKDNLQLRGGG